METRRHLYKAWVCDVRPPSTSLVQALHGSGDQRILDEPASCLCSRTIAANKCLHQSNSNRHGLPNNRPLHSRLQGTVLPNSLVIQAYLPPHGDCSVDGFALPHHVSRLPHVPTLATSPIPSTP